MMPTVSVALEEAQFLALSEQARVRGVSVDELVRENIDEFLQRRSAFQSATQRVLKKNGELYRRLAQ